MSVAAHSSRGEFTNNRCGGPIKPRHFEGHPSLATVALAQHISTSVVHHEWLGERPLWTRLRSTGSVFYLRGHHGKFSVVYVKRRKHYYCHFGPRTRADMLLGGQNTLSFMFVVVKPINIFPPKWAAVAVVAVNACLWNDLISRVVSTSLAKSFPDFGMWSSERIHDN